MGRQLLGNPTITPLVRECEAHDTFPFNATLLKELRMIALLRQVVDPDNDEARLWSELRLHRITSDLMVTLGTSSKLNAEWEFPTMLRDGGRRAASEFAERHGADVGVRSTYEIDSLLDGV